MKWNSEESFPAEGGGVFNGGIQASQDEDDAHGGTQRVDGKANREEHGKRSAKHAAAAAGGVRKYIIYPAALRSAPADRDSATPFRTSGIGGVRFVGFLLFPLLATRKPPHGCWCGVLKLRYLVIV